MSWQVRELRSETLSEIRSIDPRTVCLSYFPKQGIKFWEVKVHFLKKKRTYINYMCIQYNICIGRFNIFTWIM